MGMKYVAILSFLLILPVQGWALSVEEARHLLVRTGFAAPVGEVEAVLSKDRTQAVEFILSQARNDAVSAPPAFAEEPFVSRRGMANASAEARRARRQLMRRQALELKLWWYGEMVTTTTPFTEMMTLFWHNHFTSSIQKTRSPLLMFRQNILLRRHGLGNFSTMLHDIARDPAMLLYLDGARSRAAAPNENFGRELLELFTLTPGHYSEDDIKEIARAFTGYSINRDTGEFLMRTRAHDQGEKTILGRTGRFEGGDVIDMLLEQPRMAETVVEKLWRHFVSDNPERAEVERLAAIFRNADYEIQPLMMALLTSDAFWDRENRGVLIKSPVDFSVGTMRQFGLRPPNMRIWVGIGRRLGQDIFNPPNVKGWPGGNSWITSDTLLVRNDIVRQLTGIDPPNRLAGRRPPVPNAAPAGSMIAETGNGPERRARAENGIANRGGGAMVRQIDRWIGTLGSNWQDAEIVTNLLLAAAPADFTVMSGQVTDALVRGLLTDPVYQLK